MGPKKPVANLIDLGLKWLKAWLVGYLTTKTKQHDLLNPQEFHHNKEVFVKDCHNVCQLINEYIHGSLRWSMVEMFLGDSTLTSDVRVGGFLVLMAGEASSIPSLAFGHFPEHTYHIVAHLVTYCSQGLTHLSLRWLWLTKESLNTVISAVNKMTRLQQLFVPYIANDELVAAVGASCHQLQLLDLSGSCHITDSGIKAIYRKNVGGELWQTDLVSSLQYLYLGGPGGLKLHEATVAQLLVNLPHLVSLGSFPQTAVALIKARNSRGGKRCSPKFNLKYIHQVGCTVKDLIGSVEMCPQLTNLFLDHPEEGWNKHLTNTSIHKLKTNKIVVDDLTSFLSTNGSQITGLDMVNLRGSFDLGLLAKYSPNLSSLEIYYSDSAKCLTSPSLKYLQKIVVYGTNVSGNLCEEILLNCCSLVHVTITSAAQLNIEKISRALHNLQLLEEFAVLEAPLLDNECLHFLIDKLPKIRIIGKLDGWSLSKLEVEAAKNKIKKENFDVMLWYNLPGYVELNMDDDLHFI